MKKGKNLTEESQELGDPRRGSKRLPTDRAEDDLLNRVREADIDQEVLKWVKSGLKPPR